MQQHAADSLVPLCYNLLLGIISIPPEFGRSSSNCLAVYKGHTNKFFLIIDIHSDFKICYF